MTAIPLSRPPVDDEIKQAVLAAIDSRQYILGPQCREFETELARYVGVRHCVLSNSATAGLWLDPARARRQGRRRDPRSLAHRVPDHRGHLLRGGHAGLRRRRRLLHDGSRGRRRQGDAAHGRRDAGPPVRPARGPRRHPRAGLATRRVDARGLRAGPRRRLARQEGRRLRPGGRVLVLSLQEPDGHGRRRRHRDRRRRDRRPLPAAARPRPPEQGRPRRDRLQPALQRHPGRHRPRAAAPARRDERSPPGAGRPLRPPPWPGCRSACRWSGRARATSITSTSCAHAAPRRAGRVPEGARHPDRHPLPGADAPAAGRRALRRPGAARDGAARGRDPDAADLGRPHRGRDRRRGGGGRPRFFGA